MTLHVLMRRLLLLVVDKRTEQLMISYSRSSVDS